ncbi:MAG: hypothetical protein WBK28_03775 [Minisyncoccia bacterium]
MNKISIAALTLFLLLGVVAPAEASHSWGPPYHWARVNNPFTLKLGDNVGSAWDAYLAEASVDWNASAVLDTQITPGLTNSRTCRGTNGRIEVCAAKYGNNGWLGLASISITGGTHITKGTAKLNDTYFTTPTYNTPAWRRLVMCQEIAHDFGLDHQDEGFGAPNLGTCMDYTNDPDGGAEYGPSNEHPNAHDFEQLETIYTHLDSSTTISAALTNTIGALRAALKGQNQDHSEFGRAIGYDLRGKANEYRLDRGNGDETITHVFWLPE